MLLAIDIGNTHVHCGLFRGAKLHRSWNVSTVRCEKRASIRQGLLRGMGASLRGSIAGIALSSMVPRVHELLCEELFRCCGLHPLIASSKHIGMPVRGYDTSQLGVDRLLAACAAYERYRMSLAIVDAGSAITIDLVNRQGAFLGGVILPGLSTSSQALHQLSPKLPQVSPRRMRRAIGRNTETAIAAGLAHGFGALIDGMVTKMAREARIRPLVVATGGDAGLLKSTSRMIRAVHPNLVLEGLHIMWERNAL